MKKFLALLLALCMTLALAACGSAGNNSPASPSDSVTEPSTEPSNEPTPEASAASVPAGTYVYNEDKGNMGVTPWSVELKEDGTCSITEKNEHIGDQVHTCTWTDNGDGTFTTGAWDGGADGPKSDFFADDGSADWEMVDEDTCQPVDGTPSLEGEALEAALAAGSSMDSPDGPPDNGPETGDQPPADGSDGPVSAGTYTYEEDKGDMGVTPWIVELKEDGTCTITEKNEHIGDQVHTCAWTDNGDGTFTTGAWDGGADGPKSDFFGEDGSATWRTAGPDLCEPVT